MKKIIARCFVFLFIVLHPFQAMPAILQESVAGTSQLFKTRFLFGVLPKQDLSALPRSMDLPEGKTGILPEIPKPVEVKPSLPALPSPTVLSKPDAGLFTPFQVSARYVKATVSQVEGLIQKYKEIPGGIVLEGTGAGLESVRNATFDPKTNVFQVNGDCSYPCPVSQAEVKAIAEALDQDDLLGISLGEQAVVYGNLTEGSFPSIYLHLADHFLGSVVFANQEALGDFTFPGNYVPQKNEETGGCFAVCFNLDRYQFQFSGKNLRASDSALSVSLIPLKTEKSPEGRFLPDYDKIQKGEVPGAFEKNAVHVADHIAEYQKDSRIQKIVRYGETAAFLRALKSQGISLSSLFQNA